MASADPASRRREKSVCRGVPPLRNDKEPTMGESFRSAENQKYSETYRSAEYNRTEETSRFSETFRSAEFRTEEERAVTDRKRTSPKTERVRRGFLTGGLLSAAGAVAGAAVIVAAYTVMALPVITVTAEQITSYSVSVELQIDNAEDDTLTAWLNGDEEEYACKLESGAGRQSVLFEYLDPDTDYRLEVTDDGGKAYFSKTYHTAQYVQKLFPVEKGGGGDTLFVQFMPEDLGERNYEVSLNGKPQVSLLNAESPMFLAEGLRANTDYEVSVRDLVNGELLYRETINTGNLLGYTVAYLNAEEAELHFDGDYLPDHPLDVYFDGRLQAEQLSAESPKLYFGGLTAETEYPIRIADPDTGESLLIDTVRTSDIIVHLAQGDRAQTSLSVRYAFVSPSSVGETVLLRLLRDGILVKETSVFAVGDGAAEYRPADFSGLEPYCEYTLEAMFMKDGTMLSVAHYRTESYFDFPTMQSETLTEDGIPVAVLPRADDSETDGNYALYKGLPDDPATESVSVECVSKNGYTLPVELITEDGEYRYRIMTQYALSGEIYEFRLYSAASTREERIPTETRLVTVADSGPAVVYPEFAVSVSAGETEAERYVTVAFTGGELLQSGLGETSYVLNCPIFDYGEAVLEDFSGASVQTVYYTAAPSGTAYEISLSFIVNGRIYTIFVAEIVV